MADNLAPATPRHDPNQELMAQGVANMVVPFFGGMPATGTIARTVTNVRAGATSPVAGMVHAADAARHRARRRAAGACTCRWRCWPASCSSSPGTWANGTSSHGCATTALPYRDLLLGTFVLTVVFDLTVAVEVGLVLACVFFIYRMGTLFRIEPVTPKPAGSTDGAGTVADGTPSASTAGLPPAAVHAMRLHGALFFGAVGKVEDVADGLPPGTRALVLDFDRLIFIDSSGFDALRQLLRTLEAAGVRLVVCGAVGQPLQLLHRSGFAGLLGDENVAPDLNQALDRLYRHEAGAGRPQSDAAPAPAPSASPGPAGVGGSR